MTEQPDDVWINVPHLNQALVPFTKSFATAIQSPFGTYQAVVRFNLTAYIRHMLDEHHTNAMKLQAEKQKLQAERQEALSVIDDTLANYRYWPK